MKTTRASVALVAAVLVGTAIQASEPLDLRLEPRNFSFSAEPGTFRASVRWGRIRVRGHEADDVQVVARVVSDRNRTRELPLNELIEFAIEESDNVMSLLIDSRIEGFYGVELDVFVPRSTRLELEMRDGGEIEVSNVAGEIDLANRNGSVTLSDLAGAALVDARNGSITATFDRVDPTLPMSFSTLNGSIDVALPRDTAADLRIRHTYGGVESDFEIFSPEGRMTAADVDDLVRGETRVLSGAINGGGPRYDFYTANGTVYLRENS